MVLLYMVDYDVVDFIDRHHMGQAAEQRFPVAGGHCVYKDVFLVPDDVGVICGAFRAS